MIVLQIYVIIYVVWSAARWHDHAPRSAAGGVAKNRKLPSLDMNYDRADTGC